MGEIHTGRRKVLAIAVEDTRGTYKAPQFYINANEISFDNKTTKQEIGGATGTIQKGIGNVTTKKFAEGSFGADLDDKAIGAILVALFGQYPETTGSTNYTHAYTIAESNQHKSLSILNQDPNLSEQFALGMLESLEISVEPEGKVAYTANLKSKASTDGVAVTPDFTALGNTLTHAHVSVKIAATEAALAAAAELDINSLKLKVSKNIEERYALGSVDVSEIVNKDFAVEGDLDIEFTDATFRDYDLTDAEKSMQISFTFGTNNSLVFVLPAVTFEAWGPTFKLEDVITQSLTYKGVWPVSTGMLKGTLKNQVATYGEDSSS